MVFHRTHHAHQQRNQLSTMHVHTLLDLYHESNNTNTTMKYQHVLIFTALALGSAGPAFGTATGLNNIPTADTVPDRTVAVQAFSSFGHGVNQFSANATGRNVIVKFDRQIVMYNHHVRLSIT